MDFAEMSVENFMDLDDSPIKDEEIVKPAKSKIKRKPKKEVVDETSHKEQLHNLKNKDPEFYKFLQEEESDLLNFNDDEIDLDDDSSDEDEDKINFEDDSSGEEDDGIHQAPDKFEEMSDSEDEMLDQTTETNSKQTAVTKNMIEKWENELSGEKNSIRVLQEVMQAFHAAVYQFSGSNLVKTAKTKKSKKPKFNKFIVDSGDVFNAIAGICIRKVIPCLTRILNYEKNSSKKEKMRLPSTCKNWNRIKTTVKVYLEDCCKLVQVLLDAGVQATLLRHALLLTSYYLCFPKLTKTFYKMVINLWSSSQDESVRVLAFLIMNRIGTTERKLHLKKLLKHAYLAYVANCKFTSPTTLPMINFMQKTLTELYSIDMNLTYELAFLYIRQLAVHLRQAMTQHKKEVYRAVYNWQYVHCIELWSHVLSQLVNPILQPLIFPLVQVSLGTIDLIPTPRYFPLRFHIIRALISLGDATNTYIPLLSYILKPLQLAQFTKMKVATQNKKVKFATILKLSNLELKEKAFQVTVMDEIYELLMTYLNSQAHTIAFPEMMIPAVIIIKKYVNNCKGQGFSKPLKQLLSKIKENSEYVTQLRNKVTFSAADFEAVEDWERKLRSDGTPFNKHFKQYHALRDRELQQEAVENDAVYAERLPTIDREKFIEISKQKDRVEFSGLFGNVDDDGSIEKDFATAVEKGVTKGEKPMEEEDEVPEDDFSDVEMKEDIPPQKATFKRPVPNADGEVEGSGDIVNDFQFSDED